MDLGAMGILLCEWMLMWIQDSWIHLRLLFNRCQNVKGMLWNIFLARSCSDSWLAVKPNTLSGIVRG